MISERLERERLHSATIQSHAEETWGWTTAAGQIRAQRRAQYFIDWGGIKAQARALEIGCGTGLFTEKVATTGATILATDLSEDLLQQARKRQLPNCRFEACDAHHLPFDDRSFDVVFGSSILHHLEVEKALRELHRVLQPEGQLIFAEPNMLNPQIFLQKNIPFLKKWLGDSADETAFVRWPLRRLLQKLDFVQITIVPYDFLHPLTPAPFIPALRLLGNCLERMPLLREIAGSLVIKASKL